jgi:hypothetical protein
MLFSTLAALAFAGDVDLAVGPDVAVNDPLKATIGLRLDADFGLSRWIAVGVSGGAYPALGSLNRSDLYRASIADFGRTPDLSDPRWRAAVTLQITPVHNELPHGGQSDVRALVGPAVVGTTDDLRAMGLGQSPDAVATRNQAHPALVYGLSSTIRSGHFGVRGAIEHLLYVETIASGVVSLQSSLFLSIQLGWHA